MNAELVLMRLSGATGELTLTKDEIKALTERVNYLERFCGSLLASLRGKRLRVKAPRRERPA